MASRNDDSGRPELTIQVAEDYYTNNLSGQDGFAFADGFYSKQISEEELNFEFSDDAQDGMLRKNNFKNLIPKTSFSFSEIILSHTLNTGSSGTGFSLDDTTSIRSV